MEAPPRIVPKSLADYLEVMSKSVFQTGISWKVVESKWPGIKEAFRGFDPAVISKFIIDDIDKLVGDARIIRNRRKVEAIVSNSQKLISLDKPYGKFQKYLRSFKSYEELTKSLHKEFKFLGDMGCYHFLWVVGEKVPPYEEWKAKYAHE
jgi:3-methyladenine DNA glycosylase Tag